MEAKRRRMNSLTNLTRLPLKETTSNIPSPVLKKARLNNYKPSPTAFDLNTDNKLNKLHKPSLAIENEISQVSKQQQQPNPQQRPQQQIQPQQRAAARLAGEELYHWQQSWKKIMKESTVYFEGVTDYNNPVQLSEFKRASKHLKQVGCEITPFYDNNVTIIVSRRHYNASKAYASNDIFSNVSHLKIKVWDYDKVFRFLKNLGVNLADDHAKVDIDNLDVKTTKQKDNLFNLLKEEKIYGSTDRDPNAKRDDLHYLEKNYLYVYDLSQKVRPIAVREWQDESFPVLGLTLDGKCPFIYDSAENSNSDRKKMRRLQKFEATQTYRNLLKRVTYDIMNNVRNGIKLNVSGFSATSTSTDRINDENTIIQEDSNSAKKDTDSCKEEQDRQDILEEEEGEEDTDTTHIDEQIEEVIVRKKPFKEPMLMRNSSCIQASNSKTFDAVASGYNGASNAVNFSMDSSLNSAAAQGNGLGPMVSQVPSRNLTYLKRRIIIKKQQQRGQKNKEEKDLVPGYCENCRVKYDHFEDHIKSNRHRNFACDDRNFKDIDKLIATLGESKSFGYVTSNGDFKYA